MTENIRKTDAFIREKFLSGENGEKFDWVYRYEHSLRTAGIGQRIAREEGLDEEALTIACLLHDIGYINCKTEEDYDVHGRLSAEIAREFLASISYNTDLIDTICYGIKIHTEPEEMYERKPTPFEMSVNDADDIDRFDAYRLYSHLRHFFNFDEMTPMEMLDFSEQRITRYEEYMSMERGTKTASRIWRDTLGFHMEFYQRLRTQMGNMKAFCLELEKEEKGEL
jgi:uncharacterized protein